MKLTKPQEERPMEEYLTGTSSGSTATAKALFAKGMLGTVNGRVVVTAKGKEYCHEMHERDQRALLKRLSGG